MVFVRSKHFKALFAPMALGYIKVYGQGNKINAYWELQDNQDFFNMFK